MFKGGGKYKFLSDPFGRQQHVTKEPKEINYHKNADGSIDTTPRVLLVFPVFSHVLPDAFLAFMHLALHTARWCEKYKFDVMLCERELLHNAMNRAAEICIKNPWYVGMVAFDDDCIIPANAVARFLAHFEHDHHVVAGYGFMRRFPHTTTVGRYYDAGAMLHHEPGILHSGEQRGFEWLDDISKIKAGADAHGLADVDFCGMPAMFISRKCLYDIKPPHFMHTDSTGGQMTHDIYFCNKAKDKGYRVEVDMTIECGHIGPSPVINEQTRKWARIAVEGMEAVNGNNGKAEGRVGGRDGNSPVGYGGAESGGVRTPVEESDSTRGGLRNPDAGEQRDPAMALRQTDSRDGL